MVSLLVSLLSLYFLTHFLHFFQHFCRISARDRKSLIQYFCLFHCLCVLLWTWKHIQVYIPHGRETQKSSLRRAAHHDKKKNSVSISCSSVLCVFIIALCLFVIVFMLKLAKAQWRKHRSLIWIRVRGLVWRRISLCEQVFSMKMGQSGGLCEQMFNMQMRQSGVFVCLILKWVYL